MEARLQRRIQRYGWDLAAADYESLWQSQLAAAQTKLLECVAPASGETALDVACGTGLIALGAAEAVGPGGRVVGIDISERMVQGATERARQRSLENASFFRMDAERLAFADSSFDVVLCALGLMYVPEPHQAVSEMRRVLRPAGRMGLAVWGERSRCGWSAIFPIVEAEVASDVCPLFFQLGQGDALVRLCADTQLEVIEQHRIVTTLVYANAAEACNAAFVGGPVALAWSRFDAQARERVCCRYLEAISRWRDGAGYRIPGEFVVASARRRARVESGSDALYPLTT
jgi:ubiquinone/menaquinone biosynthesis C-methylase UbiE